MKRILRIIALAIVFLAAAIWLATGANRGWTKTNIPKKTLDDVTGLEGVTYEKGFAPGLDFLGVAALGAGALAGVSLVVPNKKQKTET